MKPMELLIPVATIVLIVIFVGYVRRGQPKISCPQCADTEVRLVEQQLKELKQDSTMGYAVKLDVQLIMETSYRCQNCNHTWTVTAPES
jgi:transposase-like protein